MIKALLRHERENIQYGVRGWKLLAAACFAFSGLGGYALASSYSVEQHGNAQMATLDRAEDNAAFVDTVEDFLKTEPRIAQDEWLQDSIRALTPLLFNGNPTDDQRVRESITTELNNSFAAQTTERAGSGAVVLVASGVLGLATLELGRDERKKRL